MNLKAIRNIVTPLRLSDVLEVVVQQCAAKKTAEKYKGAVKSLIGIVGNKPIRKVGRGDIAAWSRQLETKISKKTGEPLSHTTINSYRRTIRAFFNKLVELKHLDPEKNPVENFSFSKPPKGQAKHIQQRDCDNLLAVSAVNVRDHAMMHILYSSGARISEVASMKLSTTSIERIGSTSRLSDVEQKVLKYAIENGCKHLLNEDAIFSYRGRSIVVGKGRDGKPKIRTIFFGHDACIALQAYLDQRPQGSGDLIWLAKRGYTPVKPNAVYYTFKHYAALAGIPDAYPHMMRHTFAFRLIRNKADAKTVQELMGHEDLTTTLEVYFNYSEDELFAAFEEFSGGLQSRSEVNEAALDKFFA